MENNIVLNDELVLQWEPKIHRFLKDAFVIGMDKEDLAQELRMAIIKAANHFDVSKEVSFHTYLHIVMMNTLRTLISKAQKTRSVRETYSIDRTISGSREGASVENERSDYIPSFIASALVDPSSTNFIESIEIDDLLRRAKLNALEYDFLDLRIEGLTMEQISIQLEISAYKLRTSIQRKLQASKLEMDIENEKTFS